MMPITNWNISRQEIVTQNGMVSAKQPLTAEIGLEILKGGGNAVDAAITAAFANSVLEPAMNGIGGGGFMLYHEARSGRNYFIDYFMPAPQAATADMYEIIGQDKTDSLGFRGIRDDANTIGYKSIGVPGMVAGMAKALETFGTINWQQALEPAINYAENGFIADWYFMLTCARFMDVIARFPETARIFLKDGKFIWKTDGLGLTERVFQHDLAETLKLLSNEGPESFYKGKLAQTIIQDLNAHGNLMNESDFAEYKAKIITPRSADYRNGYQLVFGPATGGSTLVQTFNILEGYDFHNLDPFDTEAIHLYIEASKIAYTDRWQHFADEDFVNVPWDILESKDYAAWRRHTIDPTKANQNVQPFEFGVYQQDAREKTGGSTTHISVIDKERNMVSLTQTINRLWGSGVVVPGTGILFNDTMVLFNPIPGRANSIAGGKRPLSSMTPMLVLKDGKPLLTAGAPGGRLIIGTVMKLIHNVIDFGMGIQEACERIMLDCSGNEVHIDDSLPLPAYETLKELGHILKIKKQTFLPRPFASPSGILVNHETGNLHGGADPYNVGVVSGY